MSADLLREAAALLRQRAEAATPGPWGTEPESGEAELWGDLDRAGTRCIGQYVPWDDARYIATMHPGVGDLLADLLDACAENLHEGWCAEDDLVLGPAVHLARAILGRRS